MSDEIRNRVQESKIITLDLADFYPNFEIKIFDIKPWLFQGLIVKEKDIRKHIAEYDWNQFNNIGVAVTCSTDAIIPDWVYMLLASKLNNAAYSFVGTKDNLIDSFISNQINNLDTSPFANKPVIVKGCGEKHISKVIYFHITQKIGLVASKLMYGEACSFVPVMKKK